MKIDLQPLANGIRKHYVRYEIICSAPIFRDVDLTAEFVNPKKNIFYMETKYKFKSSTKPNVVAVV